MIDCVITELLQNPLIWLPLNYANWKPKLFWHTLFSRFSDLANDDGYVAVKWAAEDKGCQKPALQKNTNDFDSQKLQSKGHANIRGFAVTILPMHAHCCDSNC